jgi:putative ATPase
MNGRTGAAAAATPLAELLRPRTLDDVAGQAHLLAPDQPLGRALRAGHAHSMLLWGPPGVGKTTLARLVAQSCGAASIALSAVLASLAELRAALERAVAATDQGGRTVLFIDEIHRCSAQQQLLLLAALKAGQIILIGATTENPSFSLKPALLARLKVHVLAPLDDRAMLRLFQRARTLALPQLHFDDGAVATVLALADGDARRCLDLLEQLRTTAREMNVTEIGEALARQVLAPNARRFDKGGEHFYDQISALHKSVRGSHPDAALYWLCRMLDGGADPKYLVRRLLAMAWDDIGLADPAAVRMVHNAARSHAWLGPEEGALALAQAVLYLAVADKSNAGAVAVGLARAAASGGHGGFPGGPPWYVPTPRGLERRIGAALADRLTSWQPRSGAPPHPS